MSVRLSAGEPLQAAAAAQLIYQSDAAYYDYLYGGVNAALEHLAQQWRHDTTAVGPYPAQRCAVGDDGSVQALCVAYPTAVAVALADFAEQASTAPVDPARRQRQANLDWLFPPLPEQGFYLRTLAVAASARGQGLGGQLLQALLREARQLGCSALLTDVDSGNPGALRFYQRAGGQQVAQVTVAALLPHRLPANVRLRWPL